MSTALVAGGAGGGFCVGASVWFVSAGGVAAAGAGLVAVAAAFWSGAGVEAFLLQLFIETASEMAIRLTLMFFNFMFGFFRCLEVRCVV